MNVNHENVTEQLETALFAYTSLSNYNSQCFGMSDLRLAMASGKLVGVIIQGVLDSGNCPYTLVKPTLEKFGYELTLQSEKTYEDFSQAREAGVKPFSFNIENFQRITAIGEHIKADESHDLDGYLDRYGMLEERNRLAALSA